MPNTGTQNAKIIAQVGDTHSLKFEDMGKRRFIRLGASEKNPTVMQGTIHTDPSWGSVTAADALANLGLTLVKSETYDYDALVSTYFITGAIAYTVTEEWGEVAGILASVREAPSADHFEDSEEGLAEFDRQYPATLIKGAFVGRDDTWVYEDNSVAKELNAILAAWAREKDARMGDAIAGLQALQESQGGLDAGQKGRLDLQLHAQRIAGSGTQDGKPEMLDGRLN